MGEGIHDPPQTRGKKNGCWLLSWGVLRGSPISDDRKEGRENIILFLLAQMNARTNSTAITFDAFNFTVILSGSRTNSLSS